MNKAMADLLEILAHAKAADHHLRAAAEISRDLYQHQLGGEFNAVLAPLAPAQAHAEKIYGKAATAAVRRAR